MAQTADKMARPSDQQIVVVDKTLDIEVSKKASNDLGTSSSTLAIPPHKKLMRSLAPSNLMRSLRRRKSASLPAIGRGEAWAVRSWNAAPPPPQVPVG